MSASSAAILRYMILFFRLILLHSVKVTLKQNSCLWQSSIPWVREMIFFFFSLRNGMANLCYLKQATLLILSVWYSPWNLIIDSWCWRLVCYRCFLLSLICASCGWRWWITFPFQSGDFFWGDKPEQLTQVRVNSYFLSCNGGRKKRFRINYYTDVASERCPLRQRNKILLSWSRLRSFLLTYKRIIQRCR